MKKLEILILLMLTTAFTFSACSRNKHAIINEESGMFSQKIKISSLPTKAKIYINEREIGETPLSYRISHEDSRMLNVKAVPLYPNQYTQNIFLMVPPIPKTMTIYMNHYPEDYDKNKDKEFVPPQKPEPEIIVQTEIDTVFVENQIKEILTLKLPAIYFDTDKYEIKASEMGKLIDLVELLNQNPQLHMDIFGFADHRASEKYNLTLTLNRAKAVREFLIGQGIAGDRLSAYGHGKVSKVSSEGLDMDLQESRKVLFLLRNPQMNN
jgi:outer membrane protein OmpA-like peptidoglycan-associated protein